MHDWDDLRYVLAVCRGGGVTGAARALGVNHSTVSRRITALEERLGARLFDRLPTGYRPTAAGEDAFIAAEEMERSAALFGRAVASRDRRPSGVVTVTAPLMIVMGPFAKALAGFRETYPEIEVRVLATTDLLNLHRREADVALRATDAPDESLFGLRLCEQRAALYASRGYLERRAAAIAEAPGDLPIDWIGRNDQERPPPEVTAVFPKARTSVCMDDKLAAMAAVRAGLGLCRLPCFQGDSEPELRRVPGFPLVPYPDKWVLTHPDLAKVERVRLFMRFAAEAIKPMRPLFMGQLPQA
ncbi:LysR family transcriptional regulator [Pelagibius sp.]|uniref:LysR family transcriptional regulator n=1 Tax=Pelagibius sp. TaxID=1931238 RepID=UPI00261EEA55|nr:LysR family transcriptional regulator [Pelagibius sp.]